MRELHATDNDAQRAQNLVQHARDQLVGMEENPLAGLAELHKIINQLGSAITLLTHTCPTSLEEAIMASPIGMAMTYTAAGNFVLVHMHEISQEELGNAKSVPDGGIRVHAFPISAFEGTTWIRAFSMEYGLVLVSDYPDTMSYGDKDLQRNDLQTLGVSLLTGWQSVPNALL